MDHVDGVEVAVMEKPVPVKAAYNGAEFEVPELGENETLRWVFGRDPEVDKTGGNAGKDDDLAVKFIGAAKTISRRAVIYDFDARGGVTITRVGGSPILLSTQEGKYVALERNEPVRISQVGEIHNLKVRVGDWEVGVWGHGGKVNDSVRVRSIGVKLVR